MLISILMCTYNGEEYIEEQLNSIYNQTKQPDEVLILDDHSNDSTVDIISEFIEKHSLENSWILEVNRKNIGYVENFKKGISRIKGDIIFFSDQDDIWDKQKIQCMMDYFRKYDDACVLGTDLIHFYSDGREKIEGSLDGSVEKVHYEKKRDFIQHPAGCTMALKKTYILNKEKLYTSGWSHDEFFWRIATVDGCCYRIHKCFMKHRMSGTNVTGSSFKNIEERVEQASRNKNNYSQLLSYSKNTEFPVSQSNIIKYFAEGNECRFEYLVDPSISKIFKLLRYKEIFFTMKQFCGDIYYTLFKR